MEETKRAKKKEEEERRQRHEERKQKEEKIDQKHEINVDKVGSEVVVRQTGLQSSSTEKILEKPVEKVGITYHHFVSATSMGSNFCIGYR